MTQCPVDSKADILDAQAATPVGDYELIDFGAGRKLQRWGDFLVECPDRLVLGKPACEQWQADWVYVQEPGSGGHWQATRSGLPHEWRVTVNGQQLVCRLDEHGHVDFRGRDGIHSFCITIDTEAKDCLPHMYSAVNYIVLDEVRKLPLRVSDIYRRLTT